MWGSSIAGAGPCRRPGIGRTTRVLAPLLLALAFSGCLTTGRVEKYSAGLARDNSGLMVNAAPQDLGPVDSNRAVLFVHGFIGGPTNFGDLPAAVAEAGWFVRVMLLPGHGTSPMDLEKVTAEDYIAAVQEELARLQAKYETVVLAGHSLGGTTSAIVASRTPVDGLILYAPYFHAKYKWFLVLPPEFWISTAGHGLRWVPVKFKPMPVADPAARDGIFHYEWVPVQAAHVVLGMGPIARDPEALARIECPTLIVQGCQESVTSPAAVRVAFRHIGAEEKELLWLERSDHIPFVDYDQAENKAATLAFLEGLGADCQSDPSDKSDASERPPL
ncbi:MAG: alpha/beta fold hydrolase [Candidatus Hydrogenedentes bacterium]|nr:alpha/beta fold hydrolase [Candidatus Hydrogenedentota bacterium]